MVLKLAKIPQKKFVYPCLCTSRGTIFTLGNGWRLIENTQKIRALRALSPESSCTPSLCTPILHVCVPLFSLGNDPKMSKIFGRFAP